MKKQKFTFVDLFAGIGGFRIALENLGGKCLGFSEIDKTAIESYKKNFNTTHEVEIGDITKNKDLPLVDMLVGGVPCQSWSIAGKMKGFEDPRGRLWHDTIIVTEKIKPKAFIYENVKGLADPRNKANLDLIVGEFNRIGYETHYKVLNAFDFGLPQSRERVFVVGIRKDLNNGGFKYPEKSSDLPYLADILETSDKTVKKIKLENHASFKNSFNMAAIVNKGNFFIFSDIRNGDYTVHTWNLVKTTEKEKKICLMILKNRRKPIYGEKDGNPMSLKDIRDLYDNLPLDGEDNAKDLVEAKDLDRLVEKEILRKVGDKYEFLNSKISAGINGIYRIFLPESHVFSTLTKTGSKDFVSEIAIPEEVTDKKQYFIDNILKKKRYRKLTIREAARLQGFPDDFDLNINYDKAMGLLGNAVAVKVVEKVAQNILMSLKS